MFLILGVSFFRVYVFWFYFGESWVCGIDGVFGGVWVLRGLNIGGWVFG